MTENSTRSSRLRLRPREHRALLLIGDLLASITSIIGAVYTWRLYSWFTLISAGISPEKATKFLPRYFQVPLWFYLLPFIWLILLIDMYDPHSAANKRKTLRGIAIAAFIGMVVYSLVFITLKEPSSLPRIGVGAFLLIASILTMGWRFLYIRLYKSTGFMRRVAVVGAGKAGRTLVETYKNLNPLPFNLVGFFDDDPKKIGKNIEGYPILCGSDQLLKVVDDKKISDLVVAITGEMQGRTFQILLDAQERGVEVTRMPTIYEEMVGRVPVHHLESDWVIRSFVDQARTSGFYSLGKRLSDIIGALIGLGIFFAILPFASLATLLDTGLPIFYAQTRLGKGGKTFRIFKFRTMHKDAEEDGKAHLAAEDDPRVTRVGNFMRAVRLDEFPQFFNVLKGEMSLVGPRAERPELVAEFQKQIPFYRARLMVKPGITGWAQINYGYVSTLHETSVKLEFDLFYIKHRTMMMDILIILRTIGTVFSGRGR